MAQAQHFEGAHLCRTDRAAGAPGQQNIAFAAKTVRHKCYEVGKSNDGRACSHKSVQFVTAQYICILWPAKEGLPVWTVDQCPLSGRSHESCTPLMCLFFCFPFKLQLLPELLCGLHRAPCFLCFHARGAETSTSFVAQPRIEEQNEEGSNFRHEDLDSIPPNTRTLPTNKDPPNKDPGSWACTTKQSPSLPGACVRPCTCVRLHIKAIKLSCPAIA
eukprot:1158471-Pelagomonas_calceolata.AAC.12